MSPLNQRIAALRARIAEVRRFIQTDTGAVTVDWVVLTGAIVGLGIATVASVRTGAISLGDDIEGSLSGATVATLGTLGGDGSVVAVAVTWTAGQWTPHAPGHYDTDWAWVQQLSDASVQSILENYAQYADAPPGSGHPIDRYRDQYLMAIDSAVQRGLIPPPG